MSDREVLVLDGQAVDRLLASAPGIGEALKGALRAYSLGEAVAPPRLAAESPSGLLAAMPARVPGMGLGAKLVTVFPGNQELPSHQGVVALFDEDSGRLLALMEGRRITAQRTAAVSAIAQALLAPPAAARLAILGAGEQAEAHLRWLPMQRRLSQVSLWGRDWQRTQRLASRAGARACRSIEEALADADIVACCTGAQSPLLELSQLRQGTLVISVGSGNELGQSVIAGSRLFVEWRGAALEAPPAGAWELQGVDPARLTELGEVLASQNGATLPREGGAVCFKSTGLGVEDVAVARALYEAALSDGAGVSVAW